MRDYGKVHTSFWTSDTIRDLSEDGRILAFYLLTCPHGTIAGVFRLPDGYACEDLQWSSERVSKGLRELFQKGFANRCETTNWVWVRKHFEWNPLENPNQRKSAVKITALIPEKCGWKLDFMRVCGPLLGIEFLHSTNSSETLSKGFLNQEQEQEQEQEEKREPEGSCPDESPNAVPNCPFDKLIDLYEEKLPALPTIRRSLFKTGKGGTAMKARWKWVMMAFHERGELVGQRLATTAEEGVEWFGKFFGYVAESDFLTGKSGKFNGCTLQWLMTASKFEDVLSGKFHDQVREAA